MSINCPKIKIGTNNTILSTISNSFNIGNNNNNNSNYTFLLGYDCSLNNSSYSSVLGYKNSINNTSELNHSMVIGNNCTIQNGFKTLLFGNNIYSTNQENFIFGNNLSSHGKETILLGGTSNIINNGSIVTEKSCTFGYDNLIKYNDKALVIGISSEIVGITSRDNNIVNNISFGNNNKIHTTSNSGIFGFNNTIIGTNSTIATLNVILGNTSNINKGNDCYIIGNNSKLNFNSVNSINDSVSIGNDNNIGGTQSFVLGNKCKNNDVANSNNNNSFIIGNESESIGNNSFVLGNKSKSNKYNAYSIGYNAKSDGKSAYAIGDKSEALADNSVALGYGSKARFESCFSIGANADASGSNAYAIGKFTKSGNNSFAIGNNLDATDETVPYDNSYNVFDSAGTSTEIETRHFLIGGKGDSGHKFIQNITFTTGTATQDGKFELIDVEARTVNCSKIVADTTQFITSDERIKTNIKSVSTKKSLEHLLNLNTKTYDKKCFKSYKEINETGFIAQELVNMFPDVVSFGNENISVTSEGSEFKIIDDCCVLHVPNVEFYNLNYKCKINIIEGDKHKSCNIFCIKNDDIYLTEKINIRKSKFIGFKINNFHYLSYSKLIPHMVSGIQELHKQIFLQKKVIEKLEAKINGDNITT